MHYGHYGTDCCQPVSPSYGYGESGFGSSFALIVVLFILLIIVGACLTK